MFEGSRFPDLGHAQGRPHLGPDERGAAAHGCAHPSNWPDIREISEIVWELAENTGVEILRRDGKTPWTKLWISSPAVKDANASHNGLLIQLIASLKEFHDRS